MPTMPSSIVNFMEQVEAAQGAFSAKGTVRWAQQRIKMLKKLGTRKRWALKLGTQNRLLNSTQNYGLTSALAKAATSAAPRRQVARYGASLHTYSSLYLNLRYNKAGARRQWSQRPPPWSWSNCLFSENYTET